MECSKCTMEYSKGYNIEKVIKRASLIVGKQDWGINSLSERWAMKWEELY